MKYYLPIIYTLLYICAIQSQKAIPPIDIPMYMSGNFGELRSNHFHSGIDLKIQGKIGEPIKAVKDGYISRINISPWGYGRALYIDHPDGTTTVYAHLDHFSKKIETLAVDSQYVKQTFRIDLSLEADILPVKQGEVIGYGGNSGSSGGPHLHFELRDSQTEEPHDPLVLYKDKIKDTRKPEFQSFMVYPQLGTGIVDGSHHKQMLSFKKDKNGKNILSPTVVKVWGVVGFAVKAYDYMDNTSNLYGVKEVILKIDSQTIFHSDITHFSFSDTRYINSFIDWEEWEYKRSFYMKSFIEPGNKLNIYRTKNSGLYDFCEERDYQVEYTLRDLYGNTNVFSFTVKGVLQKIPAIDSYNEFEYDKDNMIERDGVSLHIPAGNLYKNTSIEYGIVNKFSLFSPLYKLGERLPLHSYCPLSIKITNDTLTDKKKYGILSVNQKKISWIGGEYKDGFIATNIRELGSFYIDIDTIPPKVTPQGETTWGKTKNISFKITDNLSGIESWHATLDGEFILFELDGKKNHLFCKYNPQRMKPGKRKLKLIVADACSNTTTYEGFINW